MDAKEQIPQVQNHEFFQVFATYGQTMGYVQSFEAIPKLILSIYNYFEQEKAGSLDDEAFEKIFSEHDHSTLGRVLKALECRMGKVEANVKEDAVKMLDKLRLIRNDLAPHLSGSQGDLHEESRGAIVGNRTASWIFC